MKALLTVLILMITTSAFSQIVVVDGQDTMICFTPEQSKFILTEVTKVEYLEAQDSINTQLIIQKDSLLNNHAEIIENKDKIISTHEEIQAVCKDDLDITTTRLKDTEKSLKKQKRRTRATLGIGGTIIAVLTTLLLVK